jgi:hypothetical protein
VNGLKHEGLLTFIPENFGGIIMKYVLQSGAITLAIVIASLIPKSAFANPSTPSITHFSAQKGTTIEPEKEKQSSTHHLSRSKNRFAERVGPVDLVFMAYQGIFQQQNIPSSAILIDEYEAGKITAQSLVKAAVNTNYLDASATQNNDYLNMVDSALQLLSAQD